MLNKRIQHFLCFFMIILITSVFSSIFCMDRPRSQIEISSAIALKRLAFISNDRKWSHLIKREGHELLKICFEKLINHAEDTTINIKNMLKILAITRTLVHRGANVHHESRPFIEFMSLFCRHFNKFKTHSALIKSFYRAIREFIMAGVDVGHYSSRDQYGFMLARELDRAHAGQSSTASTDDIPHRPLVPLMDDWIATQNRQRALAAIQAAAAAAVTAL